MGIEFRSIEMEESASKIVGIRITGKLVAADYEMLVPEFERLIDKHGKIRLFLELVDFHGWSAGALWEDIKFDIKHFKDIERLAIVGDSKWEKGMAFFCKPFTTATIRYFDINEIDKAQRWIRERSLSN